MHHPCAPFGVPPLKEKLSIKSNQTRLQKWKLFPECPSQLSVSSAALKPHSKASVMCSSCCVSHKTVSQAFYSLVSSQRLPTWERCKENWGRKLSPYSSCLLLFWKRILHICCGNHLIIEFVQRITSLSFFMVCQRSWQSLLKLVQWEDMWGQDFQVLSQLSAKDWDKK